ncbi:MAG: nucleotidyltransferase family protein [Gammaproteobacteria bacterium]|nr:nucleotidyltransferase family protein [Gammaproteobacteria bacterium]
MAKQVPHPSSPETLGAQRGLLRVCARIRPDESIIAAIRTAARGQKSWQGIVDQAEAHGIAPIAYRNLKHAGVTMPRNVAQALQGLTLRHRRSAEIRTNMLLQILDVLDAAGIHAIVLKGAALMHLIYPEPGLRPMRDLDILVDPRRAADAQRRLIDELSFTPQGEHRGFMFHHHHLPTIVREQEGLMVSVEIHTDAISGDVPECLSTDNLSGPLQPFMLADRRAYTLGHTDMLRHLCRHAFEPAEEIKLGSIADIIGYASRYLEDIAWYHLARSHASVVNTIRCLHYVCPLPAELLNMLGTPPPNPPAGVGRGLAPLSRLLGSGASPWQGVGTLLMPPEWWLHVYYNVPPEKSVTQTRWVSHPCRVLYWLGRRWRAARDSRRH